MELIDQPRSLRITLSRRSSSKASAVVARPQPATGFASPCNAATLAAAAASITSFLRRPPRDNSRTRAVAVDATSSTRSPRATSHCHRWRPKPWAFSTAERRSLNPLSPPHQSPVTGQRRIDLDRREPSVRRRVDIRAGRAHPLCAGQCR